TPDYISPEQARGRDVGPSADVYSLGVVAFEMVTGELPFLADNSADMLASHLCKEPERPSAHQPTLPDAFAALLLRVLSTDPAGRPTVPEGREALVVLARTPLPAPAQASVRTRELAGMSGESLPAIRRRTRWRRVMTTLGALGCLVLCGALIGRSA